MVGFSANMSRRRRFPGLLILGLTILAAVPTACGDDEEAQQAARVAEAEEAKRKAERAASTAFVPAEAPAPPALPPGAGPYSGPGRVEPMPMPPVDAGRDTSSPQDAAGQ
jgi:hypothetical protein